MTGNPPPCGHAITDYDVLSTGPPFQEIQCMKCNWLIREGPPPFAFSGQPNLDPRRHPIAEDAAQALLAWKEKEWVPAFKNGDGEVAVIRNTRTGEVLFIGEAPPRVAGLDEEPPLPPDWDQWSPDAKRAYYQNLPDPHEFDQFDKEVFGVRTNEKAPCGHAGKNYVAQRGPNGGHESECMLCGWVIRQGPKGVAYSGPGEKDPDSKAGTP